MKKINLFLGVLMCLSVQFSNAQISTSYNTTANYGLVLSAPSNDAIIRRSTSGNLMLASGGGSSSIYLNYAYGSGSGGVKIYDGGTTNYTDLKVNSSGGFSIGPKNGKVGIGTDAPDSKLQLYGNSPVLKITQNSSVAGGAGLEISAAGADTHKAYIKINNAGAIWGLTGGSGHDRLEFGKKDRTETYMTLYNGKLGIGTRSPDSPLTVNGKIHATEVLVDTNIFADYVFNTDYYLKPLEQVEKFIKKEGHLEGFKSEKEIVKEGINLKEITIKQQEKIEELTLYLIELSKEVKSLKQELNKE